MKIVLLLFAMIGVALAAVDDDQALLKEWEDYKIKFNKRYDGDEDQKRFNTYKERKSQIDEHNKRHANGEVSYTQGINQFTDMTSSELSRMHGFKRNKQ